MAKSRPLDYTELANQIQGFGIPDHWDASEKNKTIYYVASFTSHQDEPNPVQWLMRKMMPSCPLRITHCFLQQPANRLPVSMNKVREAVDILLMLPIKDTRIGITIWLVKLLTALRLVEIDWPTQVLWFVTFLHFLFPLPFLQITHVSKGHYMLCYEEEFLCRVESFACSIAIFRHQRSAWFTLLYACHFAEFQTSKPHMLILCLGLFLLQNMFWAL